MEQVLEITDEKPAVDVNALKAKAFDISQQIGQYAMAQQQLQAQLNELCAQIQQAELPLAV